MSNPTISQVKVGSTTYDINDISTKSANLKTISVVNKNAFSVAANSSCTWNIYLDNLNIESSWKILGLLSFRNSHSFATVLTNWMITDAGRRIQLVIRPFNTSAVTLNANAYEAVLLLGQETYWAHIEKPLNANASGYYEHV